MRTPNDSIPSTHKPDNRLNNSTVRSRKCKRPNALKHGIFSDAVLIPGEDSGEYKHLIVELMDEWKPKGPTLRDEVVELGNLKWKRRRLNKFIQTKLIAGTFNPRCAGFNERWGLATFAIHLSTKPETCFDKYAKTYLRADKIKHLKEKFPQWNYQSTSDWVEAVRKEIFSVLIPAMAELESPEPGKEAEEMMEALRQWKADCQVAATITEGGELLEYDREQGALLDARIERKIQSCFRLKAMEHSQT